jgi:hypothetical protein
MPIDSQPFSVGLAQRRDWQLAGIIVGIQGLLMAVGVDVLAEIALLVKQSHAVDRNSKISSSLKLIAGNIAKPARVNRQSVAQHEFHAEVGYGRNGRTGIRTLVPLRTRVAVFVRAKRLFQLRAKGFVLQTPVQPFLRDRLQNDPSIVCKGPELRI